jgi:hypothetical protein
MLNIIDQTSIHFEELSAMQFGWEAEFTQLGPAERASRINLVLWSHSQARTRRMVFQDFSIFYIILYIIQLNLITFSCLSETYGPVWTQYKIHAVISVDFPVEQGAIGAAE